MLKEFDHPVKLVVKPFPPWDNQTSLLATSAALAAHAQGMFWEYREQLFLHADVVTATDLREMAEFVGLDIPRFSRDLASQAVQDLRHRCRDDGVRAGVWGTPTIFVNDEPVEPLSVDHLQRKLQQAANQ